MRRTLPIACLFLLLLAACGDDGPGATATTRAAGATTTGARATTTTAAATATTSSGLANLSGQTIEVAAVWSGTEQASFQLVLDEFEKRTGATVNFTSTGDEIATVLGTRIEGGSPPDVAMLPQPGLLRDLATRNALQPIEDVAGDIVDANYAKVWRDLGSVDGTLYGVWFKASNKSTFWYNTAVYNDAGVQPADTWEDLKGSADTLVNFGIPPFSVGGADGWVLTDWFENIYLRTAGPEMYDKLAAHEIPWTDPSVKAALTTMGEIFGTPEWLAGGTEGTLATEFPQSVSQVFTDPPEAASVYEGDFVAGVIEDETEATVGEDADFFPFPSIGGSGASVVGGGDVAVLLEASAGGRELIRFLAMPDSGELWAKAGGFTSPNKALDPASYPDDVTRKAAEALTSAEVFRFDMSDLQPAAFGGTDGQGMWKLLQDFARDPSNVDGISQQLEEAAAAAF